MSISNYVNYIKRGAICCGLLFAFLSYSYAGQGRIEEDSIKSMMLYFRFDKTLVDSGYMDNGKALLHLNRLFADRNLCARIDSINILSFASPDGNSTYNNRLARQRAKAAKGYLVWKYPHFDQHRIHPYPQGENWQELRQLIVGDHNLPNKAEVLQIIDQNKDSEQCKALLKKLNGGIPYHYIYTHLLRYLRSAAVCMVWVRPDSLPTALGDIRNEKPIFLPTNENTTHHAEPIRSISSPSEISSTRLKPLFALKTNLLFDAALMPNIEIEVPIGKRWSVNGEYMFPWWLFSNEQYALQILMGGLEGRYWLGSHKQRQEKEVLTGHFLGLYAGGGKYDLQWEVNGYQGEFFIAAGISYGYAHRIARNLRLEYNIGIGLLRTDYRHYHARTNSQVLLWQENGRYTWVGPTKAKISLVWLLNRKVKKGGIR